MPPRTITSAKERHTLNILRFSFDCPSSLAEFILEWEIFQTDFVENIKTHILCSITFFPENHSVYEIMWKNMVQPDRPNTAHAQIMLSN